MAEVLIEVPGPRAPREICHQPAGLPTVAVCTARAGTVTFAAIVDWLDLDPDARAGRLLARLPAEDTPRGRHLIVTWPQDQPHRWS